MAVPPSQFGRWGYNALQALQALGVDTSARPDHAAAQLLTDDPVFGKNPAQRLLDRGFLTSEEERWCKWAVTFDALLQKHGRSTARLLECECTLEGVLRCWHELIPP